MEEMILGRVKIYPSGGEVAAVDASVADRRSTAASVSEPLHDYLDSMGWEKSLADATSIFIEARKTPPNARMKKLVRHARNRGLRVVLMPILLLENPGESEWRGKISPREPDKWWQDYENFILFYAKIAEKTKAEVFVVGSELVSLTGEVKRWRRLIGKVRNVYSGRLSYSANWDHYFNITWWDDLDIVGMTSYYDLVGENKPTLDVLLKAWRPIKEEILAWQRKFNRPILFTEVGWPNQEGCAKYPWNYYHNPDKPDPATQAKCFEAFFRTWENEKVLAGVLVWEWRNHEGMKGGPADTSYFPEGKPAMQAIRKYFTSPGAPEAAAAAPAGGEQPPKPGGTWKRNSKKNLSPLQPSQSFRSAIG